VNNECKILNVECIMTRKKVAVTAAL